MGMPVATASLGDTREQTDFVKLTPKQCQLVKQLSKRKDKAALLTQRKVAVVGGEEAQFPGVRG